MNGLQILGEAFLHTDLNHIDAELSSRRDFVRSIRLAAWRSHKIDHAKGFAAIELCVPWLNKQDPRSVCSVYSFFVLNLANAWKPM